MCTVAHTGIFWGEGGGLGCGMFTPGIFFLGGSTNSVEDRGQRKWGSRGSSP
jgi:hypothetical protein